MTLEPLDALLWTRCGASDVRALLGRGGGHQVVAWGDPGLWRRIIGISVSTEGAGGTPIPLVRETGVKDDEPLHAYVHVGRDEVRLKVPPLIASDRSVVRTARSTSAKIDPDPQQQEDFFAFLARTKDGGYHLRGLTETTIAEPLRSWVTSNTTSGEKDLSNGILLDPVELEVWHTLLRYRNVLLYGPPGTGKTRLMLRLRDAFDHGIIQVAFHRDDLEQPFHTAAMPFNLPSLRMSRFTTFHQSLSYDNFIVGLRPVVVSSPGPVTTTKTASPPVVAAPGGPTSSVGQLQFGVESGLFLTLAAHALKLDSASLLLIDELNRGNVADIFGELITIIEPDKRLDEGGFPTDMTVAVTLPMEPTDLGLAREFEMPAHLYLLASMNSLDRSVAPLDSALRRRFRQINLEPSVEVASRQLLGDAEPVDTVADPAHPTDEEVRSLAVRTLQRVNDIVRNFWGPEFLFGHSYVFPATDLQGLVSVYNESILPQLSELYRDHPDGLAEILGTPDTAGIYALAEDLTSTATDYLGTAASPALKTRRLHADNVEATVRSLFWLAHGRTLSAPSAYSVAATAPTESGEASTPSGTADLDDSSSAAEESHAAAAEADAAE